MTDMGPGSPARRERFGPALMIIAAVVMTAAALFAIKFFVGGGAEDYQAQGGAQDPFSGQAQEEAEAARNPGLRSASTEVGGDSLGMFSKTNAGYAGEEEEEGGASEEMEKETASPVKTTAAADKAVKKKAPQAKTTAIPRLQPVKTFGSSPQGAGRTPSSASGMNSGQTPDISAIIKNAKEDADRKVKGGNQ